jgi:hypothetical protein
VHLLLTLAMATASPQTPPVSSDAPASRTRREKRRQAPLKARHVDFDDPTDVIGQIVGPGIDVFIERPAAAHPTLFHVRQDFNEEMEHSTHFVK